MPTIAERRFGLDLLRSQEGLKVGDKFRIAIEIREKVDGSIWLQCQTSTYVVVGWVRLDAATLRDLQAEKCSQAKIATLRPKLTVEFS